MGLLGAVGGGIGGGVITGGNPLGVAGGAAGGSWLEDRVNSWFGDDGENFQPVYTPPVEYAGTGTAYAAERAAADQRGAIAPDYSMADTDRARVLAERARQVEEYQRAAALARGEGGPTVAQLQMAAGQERATQQAANVAAGARGGGGAALLAQRDAARGAQVGAQVAARDAAILRAQEIAQAQDRAAGIAGQLRQAAAADRGMSEQRAQSGAQIGLASRGQNDQRSLGLLQAQLEEARARADVQAGNMQRNRQAYDAAQAARAGGEAAQQQAQATLGAGVLSAASTGVAGYYRGKGGLPCRPRRLPSTTPPRWIRG